VNNDADQKPKWREFWLKNVRGEAFVFEFYQDNCIHVIEAAPALAEIEKLRAENADLKKTLDSVNNCKVGDVVIYHPTKIEPDEQLVLEEFNKLSSKLRAEKANEWKKMDEAKDAFAVHTTELENELEKLRAENAILREELARCAYDFKYICNQPGIAEKVNHVLNKTAVDKVRNE